MHSTQQVPADPDLDEQPVVLKLVDPDEQDAFWRRSFWRENYYRQGLSYEDYAPAYCVGYVGYAQYGGEYEDAEKSLCANWERIKGDSRLSLDGALAAIRAAWNRMAGQPARPAAYRRTVAQKTFRQRVPLRSFKLSAASMR
jgi:hypothetical protein